MEEAVPFRVDVCPRHAREVSISSVDSEPIRPRAREEAAARAVSRGASVSGSSDGSRGGPDAARYDAVLPLEVRDVGFEELGEDVVTDSMLSHSHTAVPANRVSEAAIAVVVSTTPRGAVCVAEVVKGTLTMDAGTRFCLEDGRAVGTLVSLLGPVQDPLYLISRRPTVPIGDVPEPGSFLAAGTPLHYDLAHQRVIFSPATQCDMTRGTDASYINDEELPGGVRPDFSDDEAELRWKRAYKSRKTLEKEEDFISSEEEPVTDVEWAGIDMACEEVGVCCGTASVSTAGVSAPQ